MKKLYLLQTFALVLLALCAGGNKAEAQIQPADNEIWWGYYHDTDELLGLGSGEAERYDCAIHTGRSNAQLTGHKIRAVRFVVQGVSTMRDVKLWLSLGLPDAADEADLCLDVPTENLVNGGFTEVLLPEPYTITANGVYVGFTLTQTYIGTTEQAFPLLSTTHTDDVTGSLYMKSNRNFPTWSTFEGLGYGRLALQLLVDGDYSTDAIAVSDFSDGITLANDSVQVPVSLTNYGTHGISDFDYTISTDGSTEFTRHVTLPQTFTGYACSTTALVTFYADAENGRKPKSITVTRVNGKENGIADSRNTAHGGLITLESSAPHRTVYEEFTATWSGACPRGITGRNLLEKACGEDAIWIAVHSGSEVMAIDEYQGVFNRIGLTPSGLVNRTLRADPYYGSQLPRDGFGLNKDVAVDQKAVAEASIELSEPQMDKSGHIRMNTEVRFNYDRDDAPYALGYVLLCDALKGDGTDWAQLNAYPNWKGTTFFDQNDANLSYWASQPTSLTGITYDNVAIAAYGIDNGLAGSIKAPLRMGEVQSYPFDMELGFNALAQNLYRMSVVALLFNTETGEIVNAVKQPVSVSDEFVGTSATATDFGKILALAGQTAEVPVVIENFGKQDISSLTVAISLGDRAPVSKTISLSPVLPFGNKRTVTIPVEMPTEVQDYLTSLTIAEVNGYENEAPGRKVATGTLRALAEAPVHKTYVEEYTGTWCGFCPRGTLGLRLAEERHPGKFVCAAVHRNDPMEIEAYSYYLSMNVSGYPSSTINRLYFIDPYMGNKSSGFGLGEIIEEEYAKLTEASVSLEVPTYDESRNAVDVTAYATFQCNAETAPYALGFLLRADGLRGTSSSWLQHNYYSGYQGTTAYQNDADLQTIIQQGEYLRDPFNHVPIAAAGVEAGIAGTISAPLKAGEAQTATYSFDLAGNSLVQDTEKLSVVVLLFNTETGEVINVEERAVKSLTGIRDITSPDEAASLSSTADVYDLQGRRVNSRDVRRGGVYILGGQKLFVK